VRNTLCKVMNSRQLSLTKEHGGGSYLRALETSDNIAITARPLYLTK
jgi:hypothetical protein